MIFLRLNHTGRSSNNTNYQRKPKKKSEQVKVNAANKKYSHHLGAAGYKKSVKKWPKMEQDLMDRGIRPTT